MTQNVLETMATADSALMSIGPAPMLELTSVPIPHAKYNQRHLDHKGKDWNLK